MTKNKIGCIIPIIEDKGIMTESIKHFLCYCHYEIKFDEEKGLASIIYFKLEPIEKKISDWYNNEYKTHENVLPKFDVYLLYLNSDDDIIAIKILTQCYFKHKKDMFLQHITVDLPITIESKCLYDIEVTSDKKKRFQEIYNKYKNMRLE